MSEVEHRLRAALEEIVRADERTQCATYTCDHEYGDECLDPLITEVQRCTDIASDALANAQVQGKTG